jgi:uncharacterized protein (TIGR02058 family)
MARKSMVMQFRMGTDLRGGDYTKAAVRALEAAVRRNSLTVADAFGVSKEKMHVKVVIGVAQREKVDQGAVAAVLPYGIAEVSVEEDGMDIAFGKRVRSNHHGQRGGDRLSRSARRSDRGRCAVSDRPGQAKRIILEMGTGNALHSKDYTKAAKRAVQDAVHHSSLTLFRSLGLDPNSMQIELTLAAQEPEEIDLEAVAETLPFGHVTPKAVRGGLNILDDTSGRTCVIVNAAVLVRLPL